MYKNNEEFVKNERESPLNGIADLNSYNTQSWSFKESITFNIFQKNF